MSSREIALADQVAKAQMMAEASMLPDAYRKQPANILWAMEMAEALRIDLAQAITGISVIKGKPSMSAELMRALVLRDGHTFTVLQMDETAARIAVSRREAPDKVQQFEYTMHDAELANLARADNYRRHPKAMLLARVTSMACRAVFPDVVAGMGYTPDELAPIPDPGPDTDRPVVVSTTTVNTARLIPATVTVSTDPDPDSDDDTQDADELEVIDTETGEIMPDDDNAPASKVQLATIHGLLAQLDIANPDDGLAMISDVCGTPIAHSKDLTSEQARLVVATLSEMVRVLGAGIGGES